MREHWATEEATRSVIRALVNYSGNKVGMAVAARTAVDEIFDLLDLEHRPMVKSQ